MLRSCGINVDALPLLDVRQEGATDIIGDRALGSEPMQVAALGRAVLDGLALRRSGRDRQAHAGTRPGAGRQPQGAAGGHRFGAEDLEIDLEPFERLASAPMGMTAHVVYTRGTRAAGEPVADRHPRHHSRPDRLRRLPDERRYRNGGAPGDFGGRAAGVVAAGCDAGASLLGQDGGNGRGGRGGPPDEPGRQARLARAMARMMLERKGRLRRVDRQARHASRAGLIQDASPQPKLLGPPAHGAIARWISFRRDDGYGE